jgi:hypothetical protein
MFRVIGDTIRLASAVRINQLHYYQVLIIDTARFRDSQGITLYSLDGAPHIYDLHTSLEKLVRLVGKMVAHARQRRRIRLVDMNTLHWAAQSSVSLSCIGRCAADRVVEDENTGCASSDSKLVSSTEHILKADVHIFE